MSAFTNLFGGGAAGASTSKGTTSESTSLLADWNTYNTAPAGDVESGGASATAILKSVDAGAATVANFFKVKAAMCKHCFDRTIMLNSISWHIAASSPRLQALFLV